MSPVSYTHLQEALSVQRERHVDASQIVLREEVDHISAVLVNAGIIRIIYLASPRPAAKQRIHVALGGGSAILPASQP